jgi:hypothetical protein
LSKCYHGWICRKLGAQLIEEGDGGSGQCVRHGRLFGVAAGQGIGDDVCGSRLVFHLDVEALKFACPLVLRNRR